MSSPTMQFKSDRPTQKALLNPDEAILNLKRAFIQRKGERESWDDILTAALLAGLIHGVASEKSRAFDPAVAHAQFAFETMVLLKFYLAACGSGNVGEASPT